MRSTSMLRFFDKESALRLRRFAAGAFSTVALAAALAFGAVWPASHAFADVYDTDVVAGKTVAQRGLSFEQCPDITAAHAIAVNADGEVYFERDADAPVKIASLTKIMTAVVALENASLDTQVVVDAEAATVGESSAGLLQGDTMDLSTALLALMVPSGNDAGIAIAKSVGALLVGADAGGSSGSVDGRAAYDAFIAAMNAKAAELGLSDTVYTNPHGLDFGAFEGEDCHSTARDVSTLVSYAMQNDEFRALVDGGSTDIQVTGADGSARSVHLQTTDELLGVYEGVCGVKTGTTDLAGYCFAGAVSRDACELYTVVLGAPDGESRFSDTTALMDWAYANIASHTLVNAETSVDYRGSSVPLAARVAHNGWVDAAVDATVSDPGLSIEVFGLRGPIEQSVTFESLDGDVRAGDVVGHIVYEQDGERVAETDLIAVADQPAPDALQRIGVAIDRFVREWQGDPTRAESVCLTAPDAVYDR